jgi:hypothetical protein
MPISGRHTISPVSILLEIISSREQLKQKTPPFLYDKPPNGLKRNIQDGG